jgi:hypothetical protein
MMNICNSHNITKTLKLIFSTYFILVLSACSSSDDTVATAETVTQIPQSIQALALTSTDGNLEAWITIDNGARTPMTIDAAAGTVSTSITGLSRATHSVLIEFEFTDGVDTITLATVTSSVDLSAGDASLSFADTDYTTAYDNDNDGIDNVTEIINGTDPLIDDISDCILDTSVIGGCTLG